MITNKIRLIELFGGVGCQSIALKDLAIANGLNPDDVYEHYRLVEFDKFPVKSYNAIHGTDFVPMDIQDIRGEDIDVKEPDKYTAIWTYSFPCFVGDTLVLTTDGYKQIKDIRSGDKVLSHDNQYHNVIDSKCTGKKQIWSIKGMGIDEIRCTGNHKFYVRKMVKHMPVGENGKRYRTREFLEPEWKSCEDLDKTYYLGVAINQYSKPLYTNNEFIKRLSNNFSFWNLLGRFIGDGWVKNKYSVIISCNEKKIMETIPHINNCGFKYSILKERTTHNIIIYSSDLSEFCEKFGKGASNKYLPSFIFDLPVDILESFFYGYMCSDGTFTNGVYKVGSVSKKLIYGMAQIVAKIFHTPYRIYYIKTPNTTIIEGRTVNQKDWYQLVFKIKKEKQDKAFFENGYVWFPISSITNTETDEDVYDITVEDSHSFTANGVIVHNCQDLSVAGKQLGMDEDSGTRSSLLWQVKRLLNEVPNLPDILIMENVVQVHNKKNLKNWENWVSFLESKGYHNYWQDLEASEYGIPQHRNRCFMVSSLEGINFEFPRPIPLHEVMKDRLDPVVDEKFYINNEKADALIQQLIADGKLDEETILEAVDLSVNKPDTLDVANCVSARTDRGISNRRSEGSGVVQC